MRRGFNAFNAHDADALTALSHVRGLEYGDIAQCRERRARQPALTSVRPQRLPIMMRLSAGPGVAAAGRSMLALITAAAFTACAESGTAADADLSA
ncbi:MAG: hypothetical protein ACR2GK_00165, partial [Gemmatimonadaceae bacterium]